MTAKLLDVAGLAKHYAVRGGALRAVDGVSFALDRGETLAIVGESGCGKSTVGRCILRLVRPTEGEVALNGTRIDDLPERKLRPLRRQMQVVFQDPFSSLNPRQRVRDIVAEPLRNFALASGAALQARVAALLDQVGLPASAMQRLPHEFSGGQRQRIGIARALALEPELLIADEPVSALDVSVQAQVLALLADLRTRLGLTMLFITHDLRVAAQICDTVAVMRRGRVVEIAPAAELFARPQHAYTRELIAAIPGRAVFR